MTKTQIGEQNGQKAEYAKRQRCHSGSRYKKYKNQSAHNKITIILQQDKLVQSQLRGRVGF
jgi:hypothetical protein